MVKVSLALEEGFLNDHVRISAGGRELAELRDLSTRVQIGLARKLELELAPGEALEIELPEKGVRQRLPPADQLRVSLGDDGALAVQTGASLGYA